MIQNKSMFDVRFMKKSSRAKITVHHHNKATAVGVQNPKLTMPVQMGARVAPALKRRALPFGRFAPN